MQKMIERSSRPHGGPFARELPLASNSAFPELLAHRSPLGHHPPHWPRPLSVCHRIVPTFSTSVHHDASGCKSWAPSLFTGDLIPLRALSVTDMLLTPKMILPLVSRFLCLTAYLASRDLSIKVYLEFLSSELLTICPFLILSNITLFKDIIILLLDF